MTRPVIPPAPDVPEATVRELHALYHEGSDAEPGLLLDRRILDAARAEVPSAGVRQAKRQAPWWKAWLAPTSAIAAALLGLSLTWRVIDEQEREARRETGATEAARSVAGNDADKAESKLPAAERPTVVEPSGSARSPVKNHRAEAKPSRNQPGAVREQSAKMAPEAEPRPFPGQMMAAPAAPAPAAPAIDSAKESRFSEADEMRKKRAISDAVGTGTGSAAALGKLEARQRGSSAEAAAESSSSADPLAAPALKPADDAASPEAWLKHIRELRAAGRQAEAAQSLARLRARYPALVLPDDLIKPK